MKLSRFSWCPVITLTAIVGLTGCSSHDNPNGDNGAPPADLEEALQNLGVDTEPTVRLDPNGDPLPDDYAPLGSAREYGDAAEFSDESSRNRTDELFLASLDLAFGGSRINFVEKDGVQINGDSSVNFGTTEVLGSEANEGNEWVAGNNPGDSTSVNVLRDAAGGDLDGDGLDEVVVVYVDTSTADRVLRVRVFDDAEASFARTDDALGDGDGIEDVSVTLGDLDGDGSDDIVVGLSDDGGARVQFVTAQAGDYAFDTGRTISFALQLTEGSSFIELATGNLDYDNAEELGVIVNEQASNQETTRYYVYDDAGSAAAELDSGIVQGTDGRTVVAAVADISFGDVDGDGLDEIVLGGITNLIDCNDAALSEAFVTALDDARGGLAALGAEIFDPESGFSNCPAFSAWEIRFLHVNAFDIDGDGVDEFHGNQFVFEDLASAPNFDRIDTPSLDDAFILDGADDANAVISTNSSAVVTGDVTGDGRENLIVFVQYHDDIRIFGSSQIENIGFAQLSEIQTGTSFNTQGRVAPIVVPANLDTDGPALKYDDGTYALVFTEPVIVAALAAAPCGEGLGQNVQACQTSFGQGDSSTTDASVTVSVRAGVHTSVTTGASIPFVGDVGAEFKQSVSLTASISAGVSYTVEKSRVFTAGPLEDAVVFTTIPYDRYTYTIVSHPDPELLGGEVVVSLPREPIILKTERSFYNDNVLGENVAIGSNVFEHSVGDVRSYPSATRKTALLAEFGGLENGPISVGEGVGSSGLSIDVSTAVSAGGSLGIEVERSVVVTAGPAMAGFSVGYGVEASLSFTSGTSTSYSVTVGDLSSGAFADNQYSYGMFTYVQGIDDQEFEVLNFWVE